MATKKVENLRPQAPATAKTFKDDPSSNLPAGFHCTACGARHEFGGWVYAHWSDDLTHTCECGQRHKVRKGEVKAHVA